MVNGMKSGVSTLLMTRGRKQSWTTGSPTVPVFPGVHLPGSYTTVRRQNPYNMSRDT